MSYSTRNRPTPTGHGLLRTASVVLVAVTWVITQSQSLSAQSSRLRPLARNRTTQESGTQNPLPKAQPATKTSDQGNSKSAEVAKPTEDPPITVATQEEKNQKIAEDWEDPWLVFYITGNQYGYLEPCGCTGLENQKGGINRKDTLLSSLRKRGWQILPLDAGDQVRRDGTQSEIKFHWTTQALRQMDYAATTFGGKDLMLSDNILVSILDENGNNKLFVSANVGMLPDFDLPFKVVTVQGPDRQPRKIGITGIVGEENLKAYLARNQGFFTVNPPIPAAQEIATKLEAEGCDYKILLVSATIEETRKLSKPFPSSIL